MAIFECLALDDAAVQLCPVVPVVVDDAGVGIVQYVGTGALNLPAVPKLHGVRHLQLALGGEVVLGVVVIITAQATHFSLEMGLQQSQCDGQRCCVRSCRYGFCPSVMR